MNQFFKFIQVHENEEDQAVSLSKEAKCMLSLLNNIYKKEQQTTRKCQNFQPSLSHSRHKICTT